MNYNTEAIYGIAQQIANMLKGEIIAQQEQGRGSPTIAQIETETRQLLRTIGLTALGTLLTSLQRTPDNRLLLGLPRRLDTSPAAPFS